MDRREQEVLEEIRKKTEGVEVPDSLQPESIGRMLEGKKQKKRIRPWQMGVLAAACVAVVAGAVLWQTRDNSSQDGTPGVAETEIDDSKMIASAESYEQIYGYIEAYQNEMNQSSARTTEDIMLFDSAEFATEESAAEFDSAASAVSSGGDHGRHRPGRCLMLANPAQRLHL